MKNILKYIAGAVAVAALAGCDLNPLPTFDEADSFVAFDKSAVSVNEDAGTVTIPLTIASIDPVKTNISYELVDGTAKVGDNYEISDESAVLVFDGESRTGSIVVNVKNHEGVFTGDLSFTVKLVSATGLSLVRAVNAPSLSTILITLLVPSWAVIKQQLKIKAREIVSGP